MFLKNPAWLPLRIWGPKVPCLVSLYFLAILGELCDVNLKVTNPFN